MRWRPVAGEATKRVLGTVLSVVMLGAFCMWPAGAGAQTGPGGEEQRYMRVEERDSPLLRAGGGWYSMLRFDTPATYEYELTRRGSGRTVRGTLRIQVSRFMGSNSLSLSYEVDGKRDSVRLQQMAATPGEALMAALLTSSSRWDERDVRLLWTPFVFTRWAAELADTHWRTGVAWTTRSAATEEFRIDRMVRDRPDGTVYRGRLERNGKTVLEMDVNLSLPLPEYVNWIDASGTRYEAELVQERRTPVRM